MLDNFRHISTIKDKAVFLYSKRFHIFTSEKTKNHKDEQL